MTKWEEFEYWKELWETGYVKFVPYLFDLVEELRSENEQLKNKISELEKM